MCVRGVTYRAVCVCVCEVCHAVGVCTWELCHAVCVCVCVCVRCDVPDYMSF